MIYILTGNIRTGKTTALKNWSRNRTDVDGLLCPDDELGNRYFLKIKNQEKFALEVFDDLNKLIVVGNFKFLKSSFEAANEYLISTGNEKRTKYYVIDELGKLELLNEGLTRAASNLISTYKNDDYHHLILVVRNALLKEICDFFKITDSKVFNNETLKRLQ